jgi:hypothetical protein
MAIVSAFQQFWPALIIAFALGGVCGWMRPLEPKPRDAEHAVAAPH